MSSCTKTCTNVLSFDALNTGGVLQPWMMQCVSKKTMSLKLWRRTWCKNVLTLHSGIAVMTTVESTRMKHKLKAKMKNGLGSTNTHVIYCICKVSPQTYQRRTGTGAKSGLGGTTDRGLRLLEFVQSSTHLSQHLTSPATTNVRLSRGHVCCS